MNAYEIMYVMRPEQEIVEDVILKFNDLIASYGVDAALCLFPASTFKIQCFHVNHYLSIAHR